jgi:hypothetical protein
MVPVGGDAADLRLVRAAEPPLSLPSRLDVAGLLGDCVSLATLALHVVQAAQGERATSPVRVHGGRVATAARSERHFLLDGDDPRRSPTTADAPDPTLQVSRGPAGLVTCAAPPLTFDGAPSTYPTPAHPWGTDDPRWTSTRNGDTHDG